MYGLVLEGGGAKGSYHIGAYKAILEEGIEIGGVAGTSIGALNGAMIVQGDFEICYNIWDELSSSIILTEEDDIFRDLSEAELKLDDFKYLSKKFLAILKARGFSTDAFRNSLDKYIDEDRIRESNKDFGIVTFNLSDMKPVEITLDEIPKGELKDYLLASAYLPVFKFEKLGGKIYIDGGFYDNLPFKLLQNKGYKKLILVRTHAKGLTRKIKKDDFDPIVISPSDDIGYSFTFEPESARRNMKLGYYDALKELRDLAGHRYYIKVDEKREYGFEIFSSLSEETISNVNQLLSRKYSDNKRNLFEYGLPKLASMLGLTHDFDYNELALLLLEKKAEALQIERFQIYSLEELLDLVRKTEKAVEKIEKEKEEGLLDKIIEKVDIAAVFNKENLILDLAEEIFCD